MTGCIVPQTFKTGFTLQSKSDLTKPHLKKRNHAARIIFSKNHPPLGQKTTAGAKYKRSRSESRQNGWMLFPTKSMSETGCTSLR
jgi:hypothetical protein